MDCTRGHFEMICWGWRRLLRCFRKMYLKIIHIFNDLTHFYNKHENKLPKNHSNSQQELSSGVSPFLNVKIRSWVHTLRNKAKVLYRRDVLWRFSCTSWIKIQLNLYFCNNFAWKKGDFRIDEKNEKSHLTSELWHVFFPSTTALVILVCRPFSHVIRFFLCKAIYAIKKDCVVACTCKHVCRK